MNSNNIDIVYVLKDNTKKNWELPFSLRSIERNLLNYRNVYIVTNVLPPFINPAEVIHIKESDNPGIKDANICRKILAACNDSRVSDDFLFINDDHFILKPISAPDIPPYNKGELKQKYKRNSPYIKRLRLTRKILKESSLGICHFDIHTPIVYNKEKFIEMSQSFKWEDGYVIKSLYGNFNKLSEKFEIKDYKLMRGKRKEQILEEIEERDFMSTSENIDNKEIIEILSEKCGEEISRFEVEPEEYALLDSLALKYGTDKGSQCHNYTEIYSKIFQKTKENISAVLEIGLCRRNWKGNKHTFPSLAMWEEYFPNAVIHGADIREFKSDSPRIKIHQIDQSKESDLENFSKNLGLVDIIIDDGSHVSYDQQLTMKILWKNLKSGGFYVVEDLACKRDVPHNELFVTIIKDHLSGKKEFHPATETSIIGFGSSQEKGEDGLVWFKK
jgi:hypothetical protein